MIAGDCRTAEGDFVLLFNKRFLPAIRCGQKTQTIRLWRHRRMRAGQRSYIPGPATSASPPSRRCG